MGVATGHSTNGHPSGNGTAAVPRVPFDHEDLVVHRGRRSGRSVIVAVHSTTLGPALGGVRLWHYRATEDATRDALRTRGSARTVDAGRAGVARDSLCT